MPPLKNLRLALRLLLDGSDRSVAWRLGAANLLCVAGGLLAGLAPLALKGMVDAATGIAGVQHHMPSVATLGAAYLLCLCAGRLLAELRPLLISAAEQHLYARLRRRFFGHLLALPLAFHLGRSTGAVVQSLQQAISGYQVILFSLVNSVVPVLVEAVTVTLVLVSLDLPRLTTTFVVTMIAYFAVMGLRTGGLSVAAQAVSKANIDGHGLLADGLINIEPIKCFGAERRILDGFAESTVALEQCWARLQRQRWQLGCASLVIFVVSMIVSLTIAIQAVAEGSLTVGGFVLANVYMVQLVRPLEMLSTAVRDVSQGLAFVRPLMAVFEEPTEATEATGPDLADIQLTANGADVKNPHSNEVFAASTCLRRAPSISFQNVELAFDGGEPVLNNFSHDFLAGQSTAIVGASGCGKSSLVRLLLRLCEPQKGSILLDGKAINDWPLAALRSMVGVVPQDVILFNTTIAANIGIGKEGAGIREIAHAARLARLHDFIAALPAGYNTVIGERGLKLSGGERQRIAIARVILRDPRVYVFDEATSMLDGPTESAILRNLRAISTSSSTLMIAHRLSAVQHADDIVVLADGKVAERGDHASLLACGGVYAAMWRAQQSSGSV